MNKFKYHNSDELRCYLGEEVQWLDLSGKVQTGVLLGDKRPYLPEACNPYADTVKIKLPKNK